MESTWLCSWFWHSTKIPNPSPLLRNHYHIWLFQLYRSEGIITQSQLKYACATSLIATLICLSGSYLHMQLMSKFTSFYKKFQSLSQDHLTRTPIYPHNSTSYPTILCLSIHHAWLSGFLIIGSGAHASIFNLRASPTSEIRHRDPIYSVSTVITTQEQSSSQISRC